MRWKVWFPRFDFDKILLHQNHSRKSGQFFVFPYIWIIECCLFKMHFLLLICVQHSDSWLVLHTQLFLTNNTSRPSKSEKISMDHFVANKEWNAIQPFFNRIHYISWYHCDSTFLFHHTPHPYTHLKQFLHTDQLFGGFVNILFVCLGCGLKSTSTSIVYLLYPSP